MFLITACTLMLQILQTRISFDAIFPAFDGSTLPVRALLCVTIMALAGILMGFGFPTGMRLIAQVDRRPAPWFWGVNGAVGVLASIPAVAFSIGFGISVTLRIGGLLYLLLIPTVLVLLWPNRLSTPESAGISAAASPVL